jgi:hypothetical protein
VKNNEIMKKLEGNIRDIKKEEKRKNTEGREED